MVFKCSVCYCEKTSAPILWCEYCAKYTNTLSYIYNNNNKSIECTQCNDLIDMLDSKFSCKCNAVNIKRVQYINGLYSESRQLYNGKNKEGDTCCYNWNTCFDSNPTVKICIDCVNFRNETKLDTLENKILCPNCKTTIYKGDHIHHEQWCRCKKIALDGYGKYANMIGDNIINLSSFTLLVTPVAVGLERTDENFIRNCMDRKLIKNIYKKV